MDRNRPDLVVRQHLLQADREKGVRKGAVALPGTRSWRGFLYWVQAASLGMARPTILAPLSENSRCRGIADGPRLRFCNMGEGDTGIELEWRTSRKARPHPGTKRPLRYQSAPDLHRLSNCRARNEYCRGTL